MHRNQIRTDIIKLTTALTLGVLLSACGGGGGSRVDDITNQPTNPGSGGGGGDNGGGAGTPLFQGIGSGTGDDFEAGQITVGIGTDTLSAGGTTTLTVNAVSTTGNLVTEPITVTFNSPCVASGESSLSGEGGAITTSTGQASISYTANGCTGADIVTATAIYSGNTYTATATIDVEADTIGSIEFDDETTNPIISLKGTGGPETHQITFLVKGAAGSPVRNACVEFSLNTSVGGLALTDSKCDPSDPAGSKKARSNANGSVSAYVTSGSVPIPVVVTATDTSTGLSTQSRNLRVSSGAPDQKSMSLSASRVNPPGWNRDGETVVFTVGLADQFNNPPIDGTSVSFTTNGGVIESGCTTENGVCSVTWASRESRPADGKVIILAHTTGNESFIDENSNGLYDIGTDTFNASRENPNCALNVPPSTASMNANPCDDLPEAYLDINANGLRDPGEFYVDFDGSGSHGAEGDATDNEGRMYGDGIYNGVLCRSSDATTAHPTLEGRTICSREGITIRKDYRIVMSADFPALEGIDDLLPDQPTSINLSIGEEKTMPVILMDINGNSLPGGTVVTVITAQAQNITVAPTSITIPDTSTQAREFRPRLIGGANPPSGAVYFSIAIPGVSEVITGSTSITSN